MGELIELDEHARRSLGARPLVFDHHLRDHPLFTDEAIADLLDRYPEEKLFALTMGTDPLRWEDNERLRHVGVDGNGLIEAVRRGRMWLNITNVDAVDDRYAELTRRLYDELADSLPEYRDAECHCTLLVSSPGAMVYYHVDGPPSLLWHLRGEKRLWVYPALDTSILSTELLEDVFAGVRQEYVPYSHDFDAKAQVFDLRPGQVASWPQNAPHRVTNHQSFNVSFVTDHYTEAARARSRVYQANRFLRHKAHAPARLLTTTPTGPVAATKIAIHRAGRKLHLDDRPNKAHRPPTRRVDPVSPNGVEVI